MTNHPCESCRTPLEPGFASITFLGAQRPLGIRLNRVAAMVCPRCRTPRLDPAVAKHLDELGLAVRDVLGEVYMRPEAPRPDRAA